MSLNHTIGSLIVCSSFAVGCARHQPSHFPEASRVVQGPPFSAEELRKAEINGFYDGLEGQRNEAAYATRNGTPPAPAQGVKGLLQSLSRDDIAAVAAFLAEHCPLEVTAGLEGFSGFNTANPNQPWLQTVGVEHGETGGSSFQFALGDVTVTGEVGIFFRCTKFGAEEAKTE